MPLLVWRPLWLELERAINIRSSGGEDIRQRIDALEGTIPDHLIRKAHRVRRERNRLFHEGTLVRPVDQWEADCRDVIAALATRSMHRTATYDHAPVHNTKANYEAAFKIVGVLLGLTAIYIAITMTGRPMCRTWGQNPFSCAFELVFFMVLITVIFGTPIFFVLAFVLKDWK
jgi:hypothetical protein